MKISRWRKEIYMRRIHLGLLSVTVISFIVQGCATIMQGSTQQISVGSTPSGATIVVNGFQRLKTPAVIELSRKESHRLEISHDGYHPEVIDIRAVSSNMPMGNIFIGGLVGFAVDHSTGAAFRLVPEVVQVSLRPIENSPPLTISENEETQEVGKIESER